MADTPENKNYIEALNMLIEKRDKLAHEIEQCDQGIELLTSLAGRTAVSGAPSARSNPYRGMKTYDAALDYMEEKKLEEIGTQELAEAIVTRGGYLGKHPGRIGSNLSISITQNINSGRKELAIREGKVVRKIRKGATS